MLESAKTEQAINNFDKDDLNAVLSDLNQFRFMSERNLQADEEEDQNFVEDFEQLAGTIEYIGEAADQMFF